MRKAVGAIDGIKKVKSAAASDNGWLRLTLDMAPKADPREDIFKLVKDKGWSLREIRLEVGSLEEFFVQITAKQMEQQRDRREVRA